MAEKIIISDIASPQLTDDQQGVIEFGDMLDIDFTVDAILNEAKQATGLDDFGPDDFLERLPSTGLSIISFESDAEGSPRIPPKKRLQTRG